MKRTRPTTLLGIAIAGAVVGFLLDLFTASVGGAIVVPPVTLPITLVLIGAIVLAFAIPIYRATRGKTKAAIDPFRAMRVAVLSKASSLSGALVLGLGGGVLVYLLSRAVVPSLGSIWLVIATIIGSAVLLVAGLVAEHMCTIPPGDDDDDVQRVVGDQPHSA